MGAGKSRNHRKKRISKHVLQAAERKKQTEIEERLLSAAEHEGNDAPPPPSTAKMATEASSGDSESAPDRKRKERDAPCKIKDPVEASSYLSLWKYDHENKTKQWKFNKNTQSWLLRHMYEFDKVSKATFTLLVQYLCLGGEGVRCRVEENAKMWARRYKNWEKGTQRIHGKEEGEAVGGKPKKQLGEAESTKITAQVSDGSYWNELDDHHKRKVYKRARKVLDALKASREKNSDN